MSADPDAAAGENPFSAHNLRPGVIPYLFPPGLTAEKLIRRLEENAWRGQVVGPHGSGKSALLAVLIAALEHAGRPTVLIELHDGQRRLPVVAGRLPEAMPGTVVLVDGYEQLSWLSRLLLQRSCRLRRIGLVVTAHSSVGFPDLCRTAASLSVAHQIVHRLLGKPRRGLVTSHEVEQRFALHHGNLRDTLFDLYDICERRQRRQ